jgi:hypothetical protein
MDTVEHFRFRARLMTWAAIIAISICAMLLVLVMASGWITREGIESTGYRCWRVSANAVLCTRYPLDAATPPFR